MLNLSAEVSELYDILKGKKNFRSTKSLAIVGGNTDGKTSIIQSILQFAIKDDRDDFYYIDPCNRGVSRVKETSMMFKDFVPKDILSERLKPNSRKRADRFYLDEDGASVAYHELCENYENYRELLSSVLGFTFSFRARTSQMISGDPDILVAYRSGLSDGVNGDSNFDEEWSIEDLSSSEIARLRMLMEIDYAVKEYGANVIVIDEFDAYLDKNSIASFYNSLCVNYPDTTFVIVIHNIECIVLLENIDVLLLTKSIKCNDEYSSLRFSANDINDSSQLYKMQSRVNTNKISKLELSLQAAIRDYLELGEKNDITEILKEYEQDNKPARVKILIDYWERLTNGD